MLVDLSNFKVVYRERVIRALGLMEVEFGEPQNHNEKVVDEPKIIEIMAINEEGNIETIRDESWMFQFIPVTKK